MNERFRIAAASAGRDCSSTGASSSRNAHAPSTTANAESAVKTTPLPSTAASAPITGPNRAPNTAAPMAVPSSSPAPLLRRDGEQPGERARPREGAARALDEAGREQTPEAADEGEAEARQAHHRQADQHRPPRPEARGRDAARQPEDERARGVGRDEHARLALGQPELRGEMRQQRRQRRVEHRVHGDENGDEQEQTAHGGHATRAHLLPLRCRYTGP